jgi:hypothetical protein
MPIILATQEVEIRRLEVESQLGNLSTRPFDKNT